jgi:hypothetical protein
LAYLALMLAVPRSLPLWDSAAWFEKLYILTAVRRHYLNLLSVSFTPHCDTCACRILTYVVSVSQGPIAELGPRVLFMFRPALSERLPFLPLLAYSVRQISTQKHILHGFRRLRCLCVHAWCDRLCAPSALTGVGGSPTSYVARLAQRKARLPCWCPVRQRVVDAKCVAGSACGDLEQCPDCVWAVAACRGGS